MTLIRKVTMKYSSHLLSFIFCLITVKTLQSQNESPKNSIEIGINLIKQNTFYHFDLDFGDVALNKSNNAYGLSLSIPIKKFINFHTGLQLSNQGQPFLIETSEDELGKTLTSSRVEMKSQYIKIPLQFKLGGDKSNNKRLTFNFALGPQLSFLKKAKIIVNGIESNYSESMNNLTIDIAGNMGIDLKIINNIYLNLDYVFDYSITSAEPKLILHRYNNSHYSKIKKTTHNRTSGCLFGLSVLF